MRRIYADGIETGHATFESEPPYVDPAARGRGIGYQLLTHLVGAAETAGIWTLQSAIFPENLAFLRAHEAAGFRTVGVRRRIGKMPSGPLAGQWRDVVFVERRSTVAGID